jgi:hypothetical protein
VSRLTSSVAENVQINPQVQGFPLPLVAELSGLFVETDAFLAFPRVYHFSPPYSLPPRFLTLPAGRKYTREFRKLPEKQWYGSVAWKYRASLVGQQDVDTFRGMLCQSVHFNRGDAAAPKHTDFARA